MRLARLFRHVSSWREPASAPSAVAKPGYRSIARTHIGRVRAVNEDRLLDCPERGLWAVADGMGGHSAGDVAATLAIDALHDLVTAPRPIDEVAIKGALERSNAAIYRTASTTAHISGSTIAGLSLHASRFLLFWVGDSRVYRRNASGLELLTRDHSMVQEMVDAGALAASQAVGHPQANVITRALGIGGQVSIEFRSGAAAPGDVFLLCSDGLSGLVPAETIARILAMPIEEASTALLDEALRAGGSDNISLITVQLPG